QVGAGDIRRPGFISRKGIKSIDELAARLEAWGLGKDQVEAWLADAIAGKRRPLDVDSAVERAYANLEARAREQQEFEAEAAGKKAETFAARVERETARKVRPRSRKERIEAEQRQAEVLGEENAKDARQDLVRRMEAHESDPAGAPPPGESVVPRRVRAALDLAAEVAKSGVLGRIAEAKDRATVEAPAGVAGEFAAFAK